MSAQTMLQKLNHSIIWKQLVKASSSNGSKIRTISSGHHRLDKNTEIQKHSDDSVTKVDIKKIDEFIDIETHTGQKFEENDYRLARFIGGKLKKVNTRFAIDLIAEVPPIAVQGRKVSCDGGGGSLGHPKVFINLDQPGNHTCGYCGLRFYQEHQDHHH